MPYSKGCTFCSWCSLVLILHGGNYALVPLEKLQYYAILQMLYFVVVCVLLAWYFMDTIIPQIFGLPWKVLILCHIPKVALFVVHVHFRLETSWRKVCQSAPWNAPILCHIANFALFCCYSAIMVLYVQLCPGYKFKFDTILQMLHLFCCSPVLILNGIASVFLVITLVLL